MVPTGHPTASAAQPEELRENEGLAAIVVEGVEGLRHCSPPERVVRQIGGLGSDDLLSEVALSSHAAGGIDTRSPGDGEKPTTCRAFATKAVQRTEGSLERFLAEVVWIRGLAEIGAESENVGADLLEEVFEGPSVAGLCPQRQDGEVVHPLILS